MFPGYPMNIGYPTTGFPNNNNQASPAYYQPNLIPIVQYVPSSTSTSPMHIIPEQHVIQLPSTSTASRSPSAFCENGPICPNYANCNKLHPCRYGNNCRMANRILSNNANITDLGHCNKCFHICPLGKDCQQLDDEDHIKLFIHPCRESKRCSTTGEHKEHFRHKCSHGEKCRSLKRTANHDWEHLIKFIHPLTDEVEQNVPKECHYLFVTKDKKSRGASTSASSSSSSSPKSRSTSSTKSRPSSSFSSRSSTASSSSGSSSSSSRAPTAKQIRGLTVVSKSTLTPQVNSRQRSSKFDVDSINGQPENSYHFIGYEKGASNTSTTNVVLFKSTKSGVFDGHIKKVAESSCVFSPTGQIHQPWYHEKVTVYSNPIIGQVFDKILIQKLNGVSPSASYIDVMEYIIKNCGIPVFIVGGAVRDVIRAVLVDGETDASRIMKNIKDIDMGFGCDPTHLYNLLNKKYNRGIHPAGPRGLVTIGNRSGSDLFLEGKAINGLNNDNRSVKSGIPQCYGTNLRGENICRDFTCNSLWYDPINKCILDTIGDGQGIEDVLSKTLRIPARESHWKFWADGNPTKMMRFYKFLLKGYTPVDTKTRQFIINQTQKYTANDLEVSNQYQKGIGSKFKQQLIDLLKNDFGDQVFNLLFAPHIN